MSKQKINTLNNRVRELTRLQIVMIAVIIACAISYTALSYHKSRQQTGSGSGDIGLWYYFPTSGGSGSGNSGDGLLILFIIIIIVIILFIMFSYFYAWYTWVSELYKVVARDKDIKQMLMVQSPVQHAFMLVGTICIIVLISSFSKESSENEAEQQNMN